MPKSSLFNEQVCFYCLLNIITTYSLNFIPIQIKQSGLFNIGRTDVGFVFFIEVSNHGREIYSVAVKMMECCESITDDDSDCEFMHLIGNMGFLVPNKTRNFTLIFPNMYPHNRRGECSISLWYRSRTNKSDEIRHRMMFDTYISRDRPSPLFMKNYFKPSELKDCASPDQDPLDNCLPVNCHMKYSGYRSYYSPSVQRCQRIPVCMSDPKKDMPDVAYVPMSNKCRDLETAITEDDVHYLTKNEIDTKWKTDEPPKITNMRCHNGRLDEDNGICVCEPGWSSAPFDRDQFIPSSVLYHMCTIKEDTSLWRRLLQRIETQYPTILMMTGLMSLCLLIMIFFCHSFIESYENARCENKGKTCGCGM